MALDPQMSVFLAVGRHEYQKGYATLLEAWPAHAKGWHYRGLSGFSAGLKNAYLGIDPTEDFLGSIQDFSKAIDLAPELLESLDYRGMAKWSVASS